MRAKVPTICTFVLVLTQGASASVQDIVTTAVPPEGSSGYMLAAAIARVVTEGTPIKRVTLQTFGGAAGWPARMETGEVNFGAHCGFKQVEEAHYGRGAFQKLGRQRSVLNMVSGHGLPFAMSITDRTVQTLPDLRGQTIFMMTAHRDHATAVEVLAKKVGLTLGKDLRIINVRSPQEAIQGMLTGRGAGFFAGVIPGLVEVRQSKGLHAVPLPDDVLDAIIEAEPIFGKMVIKAGAQPLQPDRDVPTLQTLCGLAAGAKTSEETVYLYTKTIFERHAEWSKVHPLAAEWSLGKAIRVMNAPYHPGAIRFYREKGVWTSEHDRKQADLLKQ